jgi:hypothetical protein
MGSTSDGLDAVVPPIVFSRAGFDIHHLFIPRPPVPAIGSDARSRPVPMKTAGSTDTLSQQPRRHASLTRQPGASHSLALVARGSCFAAPGRRDVKSYSDREAGTNGGNVSLIRNSGRKSFSQPSIRFRNGAFFGSQAVSFPGAGRCPAVPCVTIGEIGSRMACAVRASRLKHRARVARPHSGKTQSFTGLQ